MDARSSLLLHRQGAIADQEILQWIQHGTFNIQQSQPSQKALQLLYSFSFSRKGVSQNEI